MIFLWMLFCGVAGLVLGYVIADIWYEVQK